MIGQIISKTNERACEHSVRCYKSATGGISHLGRCPILKQQWKAREKEQREARAAHKRYMASARANLSEYNNAPLLPQSANKTLESFGKGKPRF